MNITTEQIKKLREKCGAGVMECRRALEETLGDIDKAEEVLRKQGLEIVEKKKERELKSGVIECYSHAGGRVVSVVELLSETDFVARNEEFKAIAHELAMQVAAMNPKDTEELLAQPYIRDPKKTVGDLVNELVGKIRENIQVGRIARFELGA
ncbi:MAG: translation elongation factor Ts [Patescibacteria group bacterium]|jgi:elongation factor Ts